MKFLRFIGATTLLSTQGLQAVSIDSQECTGGIASEECRAAAPDSSACHSSVQHGECISNQEYMLANCAYECIEDDDFGALGYFLENSTAVSNSCLDSHEDCEEFAERQECNLNPDFMHSSCAKSCLICFEEGQRIFEIGVRQKIPDEDLNDADVVQTIIKTVEATNKYMSETVLVDEEYAGVRHDCFNTDDLCAYNAARGKCNMPGNYEELEDDDEDVLTYTFMISNCAPSCQTCHELFISDGRKDVIEDCTPALETNVFEDGGDLDAMFERIVGELPFDEGITVPDYKVNVLSRPLSNKHKGASVNELDFNIGPWIVTLDEFLTEEECDHLIKLGALQGYERSSLEEEDEYDEDELEDELNGDDAYRTSTNAWCTDDCSNDPIAQRVVQKIENTTGIPEVNSEYLQLLKYVPGQYYKEHHDWTYDSTTKRYFNPGPRVITFFLYLNDVEEGGATRFTDIFGDDTGVYIDVEPKRGSALVWPSTLNEDLLEIDERTYHAALEVTKGLKYGANAWLHLREYKNDPCDYEALGEIIRYAEEE